MTEPKAEYSAGKAPITWTPCKRRLGDLLRWEDNPGEISKAEAARLLDSLGEFGQIMDLAIDPDNRLVDGHQRLDTWLAKFGPDYVVDCRVASRLLTKRERQKIAVYLRSGAVGHYNWDKISAWEAGDLQEWGMTAETLKQWNSDANNLKEFLISNTPGEDGFDFGALPTEDRAPFRQVTFTLHDSQFEQVEAALKAAKALGPFVDSPNENSNGNALARVCETFITDYGNG